MRPNDYPYEPHAILPAWEQFMAHGHLDPQHQEQLDPLILDSWKRCNKRLSPHNLPQPNQLSEQTLDTILRAHGELISVSIPFLEDIYETIRELECVLVLADGTGCILATLGDSNVLAEWDKLKLLTGTFWSEGQLGTNAIGLALHNAMPSQVVGAEHFMDAYHHVATSAAPIHSHTGRIIGLVGVITRAAVASAHDLALMMTTARAITNQLQTNLYLSEANHQLTQVNTILETVIEGIVTWDDTGAITHLNQQASTMLGLDRHQVLGKLAVTTLGLSRSIIQTLSDHKEIVDAETTLKINGRRITYIITLQPIWMGQQPKGYVALLKEVERVRQLVSQQVGTQANRILNDLTLPSASMRKLIHQAQLAARGTAPVLIMGEVGVGKNPLARAIHNESNRANRPFITIDCRAIPYELMVSEFLGVQHNDAKQGRPSKFELATGGTLLLEQIHALSREMQAALVHVMETKQVMRLGGREPIPVDVRIMATTTEELEERVADERFLSQLFYRFGVFRLHVPTLRERTEDIPVIAEKFLARLTSTTEKETWINDNALAILRDYPWPGNIRELEDVLERAVHHSADQTIRTIDLPENVRQRQVFTKKSALPQKVLTAAEAEREAIIRAGYACEGNMTKMAKVLEIGRTTLWRRMKQLDITPDLFKKQHVSK